MTADWHAAHELRVRGQIENSCHDAFAENSSRHCAASVGDIESAPT